MSEPVNSEVLLVAAEASSELYGRRILEEIKKRKIPVRFFGIGSNSMKELGFDLVESSENMAVVGLFEVIAHWTVISQAFKNLVLRSKNSPPRAALLMDYPDFNLRLAKKLHNLKIPVLYFISPQVWAWRTGRVHLIKRIISKMLVVFPFEKDFYEKFNVPVSFVGHPLLDEVAKARLNVEQRSVVRQHLGVNTEQFLVGILPGSRESELKYNFKVQLQAAKILSQERPQTRFLVLVAPTLEVARLKELIPADLGISLRIVKDEPLKILQACDGCIVASGTATLMTGLAETPMVIMYKVNRITGVLARMLVSGKQFGMANLILGEQVVPELFQDAASAQNLASEMRKYIDDKNYHESIKRKLSLIKEKLGTGGAISRVVDELERVLQ